MIYNSILILFISFALIGCGDGGSKDAPVTSLACSKVDFVPGILKYENSQTSSQIDIDLSSGATQLVTSSQSCTHTISSTEQSDLKNLLSTASYCGSDTTSPINIEIRSADNIKSLKMNHASATSVKVDGGFSKLESDIDSLISEVKANGLCANN